ncbi:hypothetical protein Rsub_08937 [Raphidocelis subcapitata]|uniref:Uncharacterized protein n=1 Tax=Raphidocelis subcapitata TaxID=307507 RepID=A0A2V0P868_9CHLO|nr:hypothetical protein Rsub_08937 [Raphidocelis subcapitata]|eukprot:GBF96061.1 hypothetical protein Rsub_08937 [Raphidocelis subcapitata]
MARPVQAEDEVASYFDGRIKRRAAAEVRRGRPGRARAPALHAPLPPIRSGAPWLTHVTPAIPIAARRGAQVGLLIGKPVVGSRSLLLAVVPSPEQVRREERAVRAGAGVPALPVQAAVAKCLSVPRVADPARPPVGTPTQDGAPAVSVSAPAAAATAAGGKGGKKGGSGGAGGGGAATVALEADWVAEHARQVARMLPGGLEVLGLYLFAPEAAWAPAAAQLCAALATIAADADAAGRGAGAGERALLLLQVDAATRKMTARAAPSSPPPAPSALRVVELRTGPAAGALVRLQARWRVDAALPAADGGGRRRGGKRGGAGGGGSLRDVAEALAEAEAARIAAAVAVVGGVVAAEGALVGDALPGDGAGPAAVELFAPPPAAAAAAADAAGAPAAAPLPAPSPLRGAGLLRGEVVGVSYAHRREPLARALDDLRADLAASLRARLELLAEEAAAAADEAAAQGEGAGPGAGPAHPLLAAAVSGRRAALALPRRVLLPWRVAGAALTVGDYLGEGEGPDAAAARAHELLGIGGGDGGGDGPGGAESAVEELEAPWSGGGGAGAAALTKARGTAVAAGGGEAACSSTLVAGLAAGAAAALAVAVGYMGLGSSG